MESNGNLVSFLSRGKIVLLRKEEEKEFHMAIGGTPEQLAKLRTNFDTTAGNFEASLKAVQTSVEQLNLAWFGNKNAQFNADHEQWAMGMNNYNDSLRSVGEAVGSVGVDYTVLDT
jgi:WXG100 family type VII secretion target